jgi:TonB family protein
MRPTSAHLSSLGAAFFMLFCPLLTCPQENSPAWKVYFSPHGGCGDAIVRELDKAKNTVLVQAYLFNSAPIGKALLDAHKRGVRVQVILDKIQRTTKYAPADFFANSGIRTLIDLAHSINHNKVMIIDGETVITESFNFTKAAEENNAENLLVIQDKALSGRYTKNWTDHAMHSEVYPGRGQAQRSESKPVPKVLKATESPINEYYSDIWAKIKKEWSVPETLLKSAGKPETIILIRINRNGITEEMQYEKRSGNTRYDELAWQAIKKAEPFPPIPNEIKEESLEISIRFLPD